MGVSNYSAFNLPWYYIMTDKNKELCREEFEKEFEGIDFSPSMHEGIYKDKSTQAFWEGFHAAYNLKAPTVDSKPHNRHWGLANGCYHCLETQAEELITNADSQVAELLKAYIEIQNIVPEGYSEKIENVTKEDLLLLCEYSMALSVWADKAVDRLSSIPANKHLWRIDKNGNVSPVFEDLEKVRLKIKELRASNHKRFNLGKSVEKEATKHNMKLCDEALQLINNMIGEKE